MRGLGLGLGLSRPQGSGFDPAAINSINCAGVYLVCNGVYLVCG